MQWSPGVWPGGMVASPGQWRRQEEVTGGQWGTVIQVLEPGGSSQKLSCDVRGVTQLSLARQRCSQVGPRARRGRRSML